MKGVASLLLYLHDFSLLVCCLLFFFQLWSQYDGSCLGSSQSLPWGKYNSGFCLTWRTKNVGFLLRSCPCIQLKDTQNQGRAQKRRKFLRLSLKALKVRKQSKKKVMLLHRIVKMENLMNRRQTLSQALRAHLYVLTAELLCNVRITISLYLHCHCAGVWPLCNIDYKSLQVTFLKSACRNSWLLCNHFCIL